MDQVYSAGACLQNTRSWIKNMCMPLLQTPLQHAVGYAQVIKVKCLSILYGTVSRVVLFVKQWMACTSTSRKIFGH